MSEPLNVFITPVPSTGTRRCGVKDLIDTAGIRTTYGSRVYGDHVPTADATAWARLKAAGWTLVGKTNLHEFAYGTTSQNEWYGAVGNPRDPLRCAGGSSGGSAAGIVTGDFELGLGTDTAGSIRIPAAWCGVVGFKPTFGAVPTDGVFPLVPWMDHVGPIAADVATCAEAFAALADRPLVSAARPLAGARVGVPRESGDLDPSISGVVSAALMRCREAGAELVLYDHVHPPASALRLRQAAVAFVHRATYPTRRDEYSENVRRKIDLGLEPFSHLEALAAWAELEAWKAAYAEATAHVDVVAMATVPIPPPLLDVDEAVVRKGATLHTAAFNYLGWASITLPCGADARGLPVGLMLSAPSDDAVLAVARSVERLLRS